MSYSQPLWKPHSRNKTSEESGKALLAVSHLRDPDEISLPVLRQPSEADDFGCAGSATLSVACQRTSKRPA